jgi:ribonuclease P protein subunit POP4
MRNSRNILQHELIGLQCEVTKLKSTSPIKGKIIDETMKTIVIKKNDSKTKVLKNGTTFTIILGDKKVMINGDFLVARPEDRIKKKRKKW